MNLKKKRKLILYVLRYVYIVVTCLYDAQFTIVIFVRYSSVVLTKIQQLMYYLKARVPWEHSFTFSRAVL